MISLHRSRALPLAGPTDNIIRQWFSGLDMKMNIVSPLPCSEAIRQARGKKPAVRFHIQRAETRQPVPAPSIKGSMCVPWFPQPLCSSPQFPSPTSGPVPSLSVLSYSIIMFSKAILTFLTIGALWVNVSAAPIGPKDTEIQGWADRIALEDMTSGPHNPPSDPQISHPETYANPNIPEGRVVSTPPAPLEESRSKLPKSLTVGVPALGELP